MRCRLSAKSKTILCALSLLSLLALLPPALRPQAPIPITVEDASGAVVAGATISDAANHSLGRTASSGTLAVACTAPCRITVVAPGFAPQTLIIRSPQTIHLEPAAGAEQITVTAYRAPLGDLESPASTRVLSQRALSTSAGFTLDDQLHQLPGVELFRRSSSLVANPTSQGISLRGLGSTSASRTLVVEEDVPLNDPLGGWIHWQEQPALSIRDIELVRGGASDLYGSSAIGGVINVVPVHPSANSAALTSTYGAEGTYDSSALAQTKLGPWGMLAAAGLLGTDGYIQESPYQRGPVDVASNVHSQNALIAADHARRYDPRYDERQYDDRGLRFFVRLNAFNDLRHNGTPYQFNATRLFRYSTGADWSNARSADLTLRFYGSDERYRQTFSSISNAPGTANPGCSYRCGETPTRYSYVPANELGAAAHWSQPFRSGLLLLAGADSHDVRIWDLEQTFATATIPSAALTNLDDHQRDSGAYAELMTTLRSWTVIASARLDWYQNFDGHLVNYSVTSTGSTWTPAVTQPPQQAQTLFDPRLGLSRKFGEHWALSASGFRAFRAPTPNELYRSTQVGNQLTLANNSLLSERATGWEAGVASQRSWGVIRASYFLTEVNRPIAAFTINPSSSPILLMRENLGQIESRGVSLDYQISPLAWLTFDGGYQYAHAVVSRGTLDDGKWVPEVARNLATLNLRASRSRLGTLSLQSRLSGRMFDDDANTYLLAGYFRLDAYASHTFHARQAGSEIDLFAAGENLTGQSIEVSKTPTTTLGQPRAARFGFTLRLGPAAR
jgi:outer membrane receptor protein involved in Fe transport